jgi:Protein of unknown function (DUF2637)
MRGINRKAAAHWMTAVVALGAAFVSYRHIEHLALAEGQPFVAALIYPVIVDGLIATGSALVFDGLQAGWACVVPGIAATLFANVESGIGHGPLGAALASWPAVAFSLATFVLERSALAKLKADAAVSKENAALRAALATAETAAQDAADAAQRDAAQAETLRAVSKENAALRAALATAETAAQDAADAAQRDAAQAETLRRKLAALDTAHAAQSTRTQTAKTAAVKAPEDDLARPRALRIWQKNPDITGKELAGLVGMSERWGQLRVKEFRDADKQAV